MNILRLFQTSCSNLTEKHFGNQESAWNSQRQREYLHCNAGDPQHICNSNKFNKKQNEKKVLNKLLNWREFLMRRLQPGASRWREWKCKSRLREAVNLENKLKVGISIIVILQTFWNSLSVQLERSKSWKWKDKKMFAKNPWDSVWKM